MLNKILLMSALTVSSQGGLDEESYWKEIISNLRNSNYQLETSVGSDGKTKATFLRNLKKEGDVRFVGFDSLLLSEGPSVKISDTERGFTTKCSDGSTFGEELNVKMTIKLNPFSGVAFRLKDGKAYTLDQMKNPILFGELVSNTLSANTQDKAKLDSLMNKAIKEARIQDGKKIIEVNLSDDLNLACKVYYKKVVANVEQRVSFERTLELTKKYIVDNSEFVNLYNSFWDDKENLKKDGVYVNSLLAAWTLAEKGYKKETILEGDIFQNILEALSTSKRISVDNSEDVDMDLKKRWQLTVEYKVPVSDKEKMTLRSVPVVGSKTIIEAARNF